ncbi:uncharacterized protein LOC144906785 [Branchiostoma floridae x Branchiostoma belcheri]
MAPTPRSPQISKGRKGDIGMTIFILKVISNRILWKKTVCLGCKGKAQCLVLQASAAPLEPQNAHRFSYSRREDVPKEVLEETKKRGEGKSAPVREFWSAVSNHLREFEEVEECNLLPLQNGILITSSEVTSQDLTGPTVQLELKESRRGTVLLYAAVSQDKAISYGPSASKQDGKFMTFTKLGEGSEGEVYIAIDPKDKNLFAVKKVSLQKFGKTNPAAFLQLTDCPQVCKPFGLILDEEGECVYFLMERLKGETLKRMLNSGDEIPISEAVGICIEILKALLYIHSKGMVHRDVKASNVMSDGTNATLLDITGVRKADRYSQFAQDTVMAVNLLNEMLLQTDARYGGVWTPSEDQNNYPKETLQDLKKIMEMQMKEVPSMDHATVEKLLEDLQSISRRLSGATNVAQHQGATCSSSDADPAQGMTQQGSTSSSFDSKGIPSPFSDKDELMKKMEALQAEKDNRSRELAEAQKRIKDREEQIRHFEQEEKEYKTIITRMNKERMELISNIKLLEDCMKRLMTKQENKAVLEKEREGRMETGGNHGQLREDEVLKKIQKLEAENQSLRERLGEQEQKLIEIENLHQHQPDFTNSVDEGPSEDGDIMELEVHEEDAREIVQPKPGDTQS